MSEVQIDARLNIAPLAFDAGARAQLRASAVVVTTIEVRATIYIGAAVPVDPPELLTPPSIAGYAVPGQTLTATPAVWAGAVTVTRQWLSDGDPIVGETGLSYDVVQDDVMRDVTYREEATGPGGVAEAESAPALDAIAGYTSDAGHIDIWAALPETLSTGAAGALGGISSGQAVQRWGGAIYGLSGPVPSQASLASRPIYRDVGGLRYLQFDGSNDHLVHDGSGLASRLAVSWANEISVTYDRSAATQPPWGTALAASATPFQRAAMASASVAPGNSNVRTSIRDDASLISTAVMTSTRIATGNPWTLRLSLRRAPTSQELTEVAPDSGTATASIGAVALQNRFAVGGFATPTGVTGYCQCSIYGSAFWDHGTPTALSVASARALLTHWGYP